MFNQSIIRNPLRQLQAVDLWWEHVWLQLDTTTLTLRRGGSGKISIWCLYNLCEELYCLLLYKSSEELLPCTTTLYWTNNLECNVWYSWLLSSMQINHWESENICQVHFEQRVHSFRLPMIDYLDFPPTT